METLFPGDAWEPKTTPKRVARAKKREEKKAKKRQDKRRKPEPAKPSPRSVAKNPDPYRVAVYREANATLYSHLHELLQAACINAGAKPPSYNNLRRMQTFHLFNEDKLRLDEICHSNGASTSAFLREVCHHMIREYDGECEADRATAAQKKGKK
jgi:hypothetical protein